MTLVDVALLVLFPLLMAYAASSDLLTMTIPNMLALALVAGFVAMSAAVGLGWEALLWHAAAGGLILVATFTMFALGWIGGGDAKLAAASALWLGFGTLADYLLIAGVAGGILTLGLLAMRQYPLPGFALRFPWLLHLHDQRTGIPYGIALAAAGLAVYPSSEIWTVALGA